MNEEQMKALEERRKKREKPTVTGYATEIVSAPRTIDSESSVISRHGIIPSENVVSASTRRSTGS